MDSQKNNGDEDGATLSTAWDELIGHIAERALKEKDEPFRREALWRNLPDLGYANPCLPAKDGSPGQRVLDGD